MTDEERWQNVYDRTMWWLNDMAFKPPEVLGQHYFECMAQDIASHSLDDPDALPGKLSAASRLDP